MQILGLGITIAAISALLLTQNWRYLAISLGAHYVGIALLLTGGPSIEPFLVELILCITAAALVWLSSPKPLSTRKRRADDAPLTPFFQVLTMILCGVGALGLSNTYTITADASTPSTNFAFFWLTVTGIMTLSVTRSPFTIGCGLLFLLEGVQIAYLARVGVPQQATLFALVVIQLMLVLVVARFTNEFAQDRNAKSRTSSKGSIFRRLTLKQMLTPIVLLISFCLLGFTILAEDPFLSSVALTGIALLVALFLQRIDREPAQALKGMKFVALATIAGACLQVAALLGGEFQISREPLLARIIVGFVVIGLAALAGAFPFHWWLVELPRKVSPVLAAVLIGLISLGMLAFIFQMLGAYPWLLSDPRSQTTLMAIGVLALCITTLIAVSQQEFTQLLMYTVAGNAGIVLAGIGSGSYQGLIGAATLLINQVISVLLLLLCISTAARQMGKAAKDLSIYDLAPLTKQSPAVALGIVLGSLTLLGIPPSAGFIGRWMIYVEISRQNSLLAMLVVGGSLLSILSFVPMFQRLLQGLAIENAIPLQIPNFEASRSGWPKAVPYRAVLLVLALLPLIAGVYPVPVLQAITDVLKGFQVQ